jgi:hypothetical protein
MSRKNGPGFSEQEPRQIKAVSELIGQKRFQRHRIGLQQRLRHVDILARSGRRGVFW